MYYILLNPLASTREKQLKKIRKDLNKKNIPFREVNILHFERNALRLVSRCKSDDVFVVVGGDGTLNNLGNRIRKAGISQRILYYAAGSGNDFSRDFKEKFIDITDMIQNLPVVTVDNSSEERIFFNGVGIGIEGDVCNLVNNKKKKKGDYFRLALKVFKNFKGFDLHVKADEKEYDFTNCRIASIMYGKYQGGGMKWAPDAKRDGYLHLVVSHNVSTFLTVLIFPLIFLGWHKLIKRVTIIDAKEFEITSNRKNYFQYDGETIADVQTVHAIKK